MSFGTWTPRHYTDSHGRKLPSATTILSLLDKPALVGWAAKTVTEYVRERALGGNGDGPVDRDRLVAILDAAPKEWRKVSRKAMDIGTAVHQAIETILKGGREPEAPSPEMLAALVAFYEWRDAVGLKPFSTECTVYGDGYAGTADLVATVNGRLYLVDFKTSSGVWPEYYLQTAAYRAAWNLGNRYHQLDGHGILRLDKATGKPEWVDASARYERDYEAFRLLVQFWHLTRGEA